MATEILATGSGAATSSNVVIAAGTLLTVGLKGAGAGARVNAELYDGAAWVPAGVLAFGQFPSVIDGPGTYRFVRVAGTCGVFSG